MQLYQKSIFATDKAQVLEGHCGTEAETCDEEGKRLTKMILLRQEKLDRKC